MTTNKEIREYLDYLLEHEATCARENCAVCRCAQNIYESARKLLFAGIAYPEVTITARRGASERPKPAGSARRAAKRAA